jgi:hypothetical protein
MARQVSFTVDNVQITIVEDGGALTVSYSLGSSYAADFRGFFFKPTANVGQLSATGSNVTEVVGRPNGVKDLGNGANINGEVGNALRPTFGVEIGSAGIGKDDVQSGSFVITSSGGPLTLEDLGDAIGVRLTSVGVAGGKREDSLKLLGDIPAAPDAKDDERYVELGDAVTIPVLANDTDADSALDPSSVQVIAGPSQGGATVNPDGSVTYADTIADNPSPADDSAVDTFTYRVEDTDGNFDEASVKVNVVDPLVETKTDTDLTINGQSVSLTVATEDRTANASSFVGVDIQVGELERADVNIAFVFDASSSISSAAYAQQILAIQTTINQLRTQFAGAENDVSVQLIRFASGADASGVLDLYSGALNNISALAITAQIGGQTNYEDALGLADAFIDGQDPTGTEDNFVLFVSDGEPTAGGSFTDEANDLRATASVTAVGFGGGVNVSTLNQVDNTGGAQVVANAAALGSVFAASPLFDAVLVDFDLTLTVDGGAPVVLADDASDVTNNGGGSYSFDLASVAGLSGLLGSSNVFDATAVFDADGDLATLGDRTTLTTQNIVNGAVPAEFWV